MWNIKELRYGTDNKNEIPVVCDEQLVPSFVPEAIIA